METFVWDQNFVTGEGAVDEQHQGLVAVFNDLSNALQRSQEEGGQQRLEDTYQRMVQLAVAHFADEEQLMRSSGLDVRHTQQHWLLHKQFMDQVATMWAARGALQDPAQSLEGFLTSWLGLHILGIDQSMARQIQAIRGGLSPEQAYEQELQAHDQGVQALIRMVGRLYQVLSEQNAELAQANATLEERVAQRTQELAHANERLAAMARIDGLLQIANRGYFDECLPQACANAVRRQQPLGLLMIDVDQFKRYNDSYGHPAGDACLQAVAQAVQQALPRSTDMLARYGGEELVVLLPDTDVQGATVVAQRIVDQVAALALEHRSSSVAGHVTVSVGAVSQIPLYANAGAQLLAAADGALYAAKEGGRNGWRLAQAQAA